jgi:hypothetical protein
VLASQGSVTWRSPVARRCQVRPVVSRLATPGCDSRTTQVKVYKKRSGSLCHPQVGRSASTLAGFSDRKTKQNKNPPPSCIPSSHPGALNAQGQQAPSPKPGRSHASRPSPISHQPPSPQQAPAPPTTSASAYRLLVISTWRLLAVSLCKSLAKSLRPPRSRAFSRFWLLVAPAAWWQQAQLDFDFDMSPWVLCALCKTKRTDMMSTCGR